VGPLRRLIGALAVAGLVLGGVVLYRRRLAQRRSRVDLYYESGSMISLDEGSPAAERLLPLARETLQAARS
jgi:hypothetical protein